MEERWTKKQVDSLEEACLPLVKWLKENGNPHTKAIVTQGHAEVLTGEICAQLWKREECQNR